MIVLLISVVTSIKWSLSSEITWVAYCPVSSLVSWVAKELKKVY